MARYICMLTALALGSAIVSRPAVAQQGSSVSLTHTVTVTVPPRVKVQVQSAPQISSTQSTDGLALSVNATQPWTLSIGSAARSSKVQWSLDQTSGFANVSARHTTVASGTLSQTPTTAMVFFRNAAKAGTSGDENPDGSNAVMLTVVAP